MPGTGWTVLTAAEHILPGAPTALVKSLMEMRTWQDTLAGTSDRPQGLPIGTILMGLQM